MRDHQVGSAPCPPPAHHRDAPHGLPRGPLHRSSEVPGCCITSAPEPGRGGSDQPTLASAPAAARTRLHALTHPHRTRPRRRRGARPTSSSRATATPRSAASRRAAPLTRMSRSRWARRPSRASRCATSAPPPPPSPPPPSPPLPPPPSPPPPSPPPPARRYLTAVLPLLHDISPRLERLIELQEGITYSDLFVWAVLSGHFEMAKLFWRPAGWLKATSSLSEHSAPSASLDRLKAQAAPTHPGAPPEQLGGSPWPSPPHR